jgi:glutathione S-transferase
MVELYFSPGACSFVPHMGLELARASGGSDYVAHLVKLHKGEHRTAEFVAMNPESQVPLLRVDGRSLTQIVAICDWIDRSAPQARLLPTDSWERAQAMSKFAWMNNTAHPTFTHVFMPQKFTDDPAAQASIKQHATVQFRGHLERVQSWLEAGGKPFLGGEAPGFLDAYALTLLRWGGFAGIDPESLPALWAMVQRLAAVEPVQEVIGRERLQLNVYLKG